MEYERVSIVPGCSETETSGTGEVDKEQRGRHTVHRPHLRCSSKEIPGQRVVGCDHL